jgi:HlyD family secretion protein
MSPKIRYCLFCIFILLFLSCNNNTDQLVYHKVERTTFSDVLQVSGSVNAKNSSTVSSPLRYDLTIVSIVDDGTVVKMGDTICVLENKELLNQYNTLLTSVEGAKAQYNKSKANLNLNFAILEAQVKNNEAQTSITNLDSLEIIYLSDQQRKIKEIELKIASIEKAKYESKLAFLKLINASELKKQELIIRRNENRAQNIKSDLDKMIITAPRDGLALRSRSWMTGNKLQPGDQVWGSPHPLSTCPICRLCKLHFRLPNLIIGEFQLMIVLPLPSMQCPATMPGER